MVEMNTVKAMAKETVLKQMLKTVHGCLLRLRKYVTALDLI